MLAYLLGRQLVTACFEVKKTNFFLEDLLENRVDTTYIHKEWSKIVTFFM